MRELKIFIDGQEAGAVRRNETVRLTVRPGEHEVYVKMDWVRSPAVTIAAGEEVDVRLVAVLPQHRLEVFKSLLRPSRGLTLRQE